MQYLFVSTERAIVLWFIDTEEMKTEYKIQCPHMRGMVDRKVSCLAGLWHLDCRECNHPDKQLVEIRKDLDNWKLELIVCNNENRN